VTVAAWNAALFLLNSGSARGANRKRSWQASVGARHPDIFYSPVPCAASKARLRSGSPAIARAELTGIAVLRPQADPCGIAHSRRAGLVFARAPHHVTLGHHRQT
jgi:hypothetical protein